MLSDPEVYARADRTGLFAIKPERAHARRHAIIEAWFRANGNREAQAAVIAAAVGMLPKHVTQCVAYYPTAYQKRRVWGAIKAVFYSLADAPVLPPDVDTLVPNTPRAPRRSCEDLVSEVRAWFEARGNAWATVAMVADGVNRKRQIIHELFNRHRREIFERQKSSSSRSGPAPYIYRVADRPAATPQTETGAGASAHNGGPVPALVPAPVMDNPDLLRGGEMMLGRILLAEGHGMPPQVAMELGARIALELMGGNIEAARGVLEAGWVTDREDARPLTSKRIMALSMSELGLPVRIANSLEERGILNFRALLECRQDELLSIPNFGPNTVQLVRGKALIWHDLYQRLKAAEI